MHNKFISGLLVGAVVGTALAIYLNSDKGKQLLADLKVDADDIKDEMKAGIVGVRESLHQLLSKAKQVVADLEQKLTEEKTA